MIKYTFLLSGLLFLNCAHPDHPAEKTTSDTVHTAAAALDKPSADMDTITTFESYRNALTAKEFPMRFKTGDDFQMDAVTPALYQRFKLQAANNPGGLLFENDRYTLLLDLIAGDVTVPAFVTYTNEGVKIDSLIFFDNSYEDENMFSQETAVINKDLVIHRYDSVFSWQTEGKKLTHAAMRTFTINADGKFIKQ